MVEMKNSCNLKCCKIRTRHKLVVVVLLLVVWSLLGIPIAFHFLPNKDESSNSLCLAAIGFEDDPVCHKVLLAEASEKNFSISEPTLVIPVAKNASKENEIILDNVLEFSTEECAEVLVPFLCKYFYELVCDENGQTSTPYYSECLNISTGVCQKIWSIPDLILPQCDTLPDFTPIFHEDPGNKSCFLECTERFFCDENYGKCFPHCPDWNTFSTTTTAVADIVIATTSVVGAIAGICVIIVSCIRRQTVYSFPSVLVVYETLSMLAYSVTQVAYIPMQFNIWWVSHALVLFWAIGHPFEAKQFKTIMRFRTAHIIIVVTGILVPMIPVLAVIVYDVISPQEYGTAGFELLTTPPLYCGTVSENSFFYFILLPNAFLALTGITALALTVWKIHTKYGIVKSIRHNTTIGTAEKKLLLRTCYCIFLEVGCYFSDPQDNFVNEIQAYFLCEQDGVNRDSPCSRSGFEHSTQEFVFVTFYCLAILIPAVNFMLVVDCNNMKKKARKITNIELCRKLTMKH